MDSVCPLVQPPAPPPRGPRSAGRPTPSPHQRPIGLAGLLNPSPSHPSATLGARPPTPPPTAIPQQPQQPTPISGDPWTSFFPQLPQTRRRRAPASPRTRSDPAVASVAQSGGIRTPSPYPRNASDPSPDPYLHASAGQALSVSAGGSWVRKPAPIYSPDDYTSQGAPQAVGWSGDDRQQRKRKRAGAEGDERAGSPGVRIADSSLPAGEPNHSGVTFYRQVAPRRAVGDEPILFVSAASEPQSALLYPPPPDRQPRLSYAGSQVASTPQSSHTSYYEERSSPPDVPGLLYGSSAAEQPRQRITSRDRLAGDGRFGGSPDPSSSPMPHSFESARASERENSLRMTGLPSFEHVQQRRFPGHTAQSRIDSDPSARHGFPDDRLASSPPLSQAWYPPQQIVQHHQREIHSASSRTDSLSSVGHDGGSARSSLSNLESHGPTTALTTPSIGLVESPPSSSSRSRQGSGSSRYLGSPPMTDTVGSRSLDRGSFTLSNPAALGARNRPASFDQAEREPKRRRAGSLSHNPFPPSGPTASNPQEPRRSSTPVDRRAAASHGRSDSSDYERYLDATPRARARPTVWRQNSHSVVSDGAKPPELDRRFSDPISNPASTTTMPALNKDRSVSRTPTASPGSSGDYGHAAYALSEGTMSSTQRSPRKRAGRPAPFTGVERTFTFGSPTKPRNVATEPHRSTPLPSMWLAPPDASGDASQEGPDGRHVRLPSLTEALRELEVREAGRR